jgi:hypothetical protein
MTWQKWIETSPAWDKRSNLPRKNFGVSSASLFFYLKKVETNQTLEWVVDTAWYLPEIQKEWEENGTLFRPKPQGNQLCGHSRPVVTEASEGDDKIYDVCKITGGPCVGDCTYITQDLWDALLRKGSDGVWELLEAKHAEWFKEPA